MCLECFIVNPFYMQKSFVGTVTRHGKQLDNVFQIYHFRKHYSHCGFPLNCYAIETVLYSIAINHYLELLLAWSLLMVTTLWGKGQLFIINF